MASERRSLKAFARRHKLGLIAMAIIAGMAIYAQIYSVLPALVGLSIMAWANEPKGQTDD